MGDDSESILDELLVLKCRRGDVRAWRELVQRYERRLYYFIRRLVAQERDALDILQQVWIAAIKGMPGLSEPRTLRTWLYRIARNNAISHLRRAGTRIESVDPEELQEVAEKDWDDADPCWPEEAPQRLHAAIAQLTVPHREVITLYFLEDASVEEIADVTGVPPGTVKSRLFYAKRALRNALSRPELE